MTCPQCDSSELIRSDSTKLSGTYRGVDVTVSMPGLQCPKCGYSTIEGRDMGTFQAAAREAFEKSEHLKRLATEVREAEILLQEAYWRVKAIELPELEERVSEAWTSVYEAASVMIGGFDASVSNVAAVQGWSGVQFVSEGRAFLGPAPEPSEAASDEQYALAA
jgi:YgiT-type zinc finger domain-containing protein